MEVKATWGVKRVVVSRNGKAVTGKLAGTTNPLLRRPGPRIAVQGAARPVNG